MILYVTLGVCAIGAAYLVYRYDLYDREPILLLALAVGMGAAAMTLAGRLETAAFKRLATDGPGILAGVGASLEEVVKLFVVGLLAVVARRWFNDPMDGLIYGSMAGLGAAVEEAISVLRLLPNASAALAGEELVRLSGHLVMGGIGGFGVGCFVFRWKRWPLAVIASYLAAVLLHFGWDLAALRADSGATLGSREALLGAALMLAGLLLYGRLVVLGERWSQRVFAPDQPPAKVWRWPWSKKRLP